MSSFCYAKINRVTLFLRQFGCFGTITFADIISVMNKDMIAYRDCWLAVAEFERQELQATSLHERWQQLNAIIGLAIGLGIMKSDQSEEEVHLQWAKLKKQLNNLNSPV